MNKLRSASPIPYQPWNSWTKQICKSASPTEDLAYFQEPVVKISSEHLTEEKEKPKPQPEEELQPDLPANGLEDLSSVDHVIVTRKLKVKGVLLLRGKKNKFYITSSDPRTIYTVEEMNRWWVGYLLYNLRPLELKVTNSSGVEVMRIIRPFAFTTRILPCATQRIFLKSADDQKIGTIEQVWTAVRPLMVVRNADGEPIFSIRGPLVTLNLFNDLNFEISRIDGQCVGGCYKKWQGVVHALFLAPITDQYSIAFDKNLKLEEKALLLAASILIDYMYYSV